MPTSAEWAVEKLIQLWSAAKAEVICMDVAKHDEVWRIPVIYRT